MYFRIRLREAFYKYENKCLDREDSRLVSDQSFKETFNSSDAGADIKLAYAYWKYMSEGKIDGELSESVGKILKSEIDEITYECEKECELNSKSPVKLLNDRILNYISDSTYNIRKYERANSDLLEKMRSNDGDEDNNKKVEEQKKLFHNGKIFRLLNDDAKLFRSCKKLEANKIIADKVGWRNVNESKVNKKWNKVDKWISCLGNLALALGIALTLATGGAAIAGYICLSIGGLLTGYSALRKFGSTIVSSAQKIIKGPAHVQKRYLEKKVLDNQRKEMRSDKDKVIGAQKISYDNLKKKGRLYELVQAPVDNPQKVININEKERRMLRVHEKTYARFLKRGKLS